MSSLLTSIDPATGKEIVSYPAFDEPKIALRIEQAHKAFGFWRTTDFAQRANVLNAVAAQLRRQKEALAQLATQEMGKPIVQSREEVEKCARCLEYYATHGAQMLQDEIVPTDAVKSYIAYKPLGVIFAIMPWNFPYWQVFRAFAPAVMAGNTVLLKHASNVSGCALAIEKVIRDAGSPTGLFHTLLMPAAGVARVIEDRAVAAVTLTGSTAAGRKVAALAGHNLKPVVLELGGSDPYIILKDADLELAAQVLVRGRLINSGQSCIAAKRFIVVKEVRKAFEQLVIAKIAEATWGDPKNESNTIGPMARKDLRDELHDQVQRSVAAGAKLLCGGTLPDREGWYYPPTLLTRVKPGMPAYHEELFGPVGVIIEAKDATEAMVIANDSEYGLGGGIFSADRDLAERMAADELEAGNCFVNDFVHSNPSLPFGGIKASGIGRELGVFGIRSFVNVKTVYMK